MTLSYQNGSSLSPSTSLKENQLSLAIVLLSHNPFHMVADSSLHVPGHSDGKMLHLKSVRRHDNAHLKRYLMFFGSGLVK